MFKKAICLFCAGCMMLVLGCGPKEETVGNKGTAATGEPDYVTVQHILIGFEGSVPGKDITRTKEEAKLLAEELFAKARAGEDFDTMVETYTDDSSPGIYGMANHNATPDQSRQIYARAKMVPSFGDVGFSLKVGEVGLAVYDEDKSKYGWHIIKRLR